MSTGKDKTMDGRVLRLETRNGVRVANPSGAEPGELGARLRRELIGARAIQQQAQLLVFRISNFNLLVETFGGDFGCAAEQALLAHLNEKLRKREPVQHIKPGEFGIVGRGIQSVNALNTMATRMVECGTGIYEVNGVACRLKIDIGAAAYPEDSEDPKELLRFARFAVCNVDPRQAISFNAFSYERLARQQSTFRIEAEMETALAEDRFTLQYQPQFAIGTGQITGVEALARLATTDGTDITPDEFIPAAEDNGFIIKLGRWVIREACRQLAEWREAGCEVPRVGINLSPQQLHDPELLAVIESAITAGGLKFGDLEMEITERCLMENSRTVTDMLHALRARGIRIAIDDFGTGYSSFAYLAWQPLDRVKLDRSFLAGLSDDIRTGTVVSSMIAMSRELGMDVIGEGVENKRQTQFLHEHGCEFAQGFALAHPLDPGEIPPLLKTLGEKRPSLRAVQPG
jgi:EAL domain-containing protein (putative c-di-GMP-specific phosphodiesterase class I)/GGDEF domain-containing protein